MLQTISRVNRPYKNPKTGKVYQYGYIVDFVDIENEYDRTIEMYRKEMEDDFNDDSDEHFSLAGLVIGPEDIDKKYHAYQAHMNTLVDSSVNLELFSQQLVKLDRDTLLAIRHDLNGIKDCRTEFLLSRAMTLAAQIDEDRIKKMTRKAMRQQLGYLRRNLKMIHATEKKLREKLSAKLREKLSVVEVLYAQQKEMFERGTHWIDEYIVNLS